ncbi:oxygen-independent coproporphyrinogen III oxidase [Halomonas denitrificans]|nr:oxygen-independent coproporphyrinogen III oxidase [Halomonas denitrificans]
MNAPNPRSLRPDPSAVRPRFDGDLIARHGGEGPRYTSYPTALQFAETFGPIDWTAALAESNRLPIPADLSLYVHVPFCANPCFYCGCNRVITRSASAGSEFLVHLERELDLVAPHIDDDRVVRQVHLGGGTPTFLTPPQIDQLMRLLRSHFHFADDAEIGLEADPRSLEPADLRALRESGFNRLSMGIQDLDPAVQAAVNRVHDLACVSGLLGAARGAGFDSISVDLIYGLPLQTTEAFARTIEHIVAMNPDRISLFNYAHMPDRFKAQRQIRSEDLPSPETRLALFRNSLDRLLDAGYEFIGMDHFARPDDKLARARRAGTMTRNFQGYSTHGGLDLLAFGPSAISQVGDAFAQNHRALPDWQIDVTSGRLPVARGRNRSVDDRLRAEVISDIMCSGEIRFRRYERDYELRFESYFAGALAALNPLVEDGLVERFDGGFRASADGRLFLRAIAMPFDAYLRPAGGRSAAEARSTSGRTTRYSRIV